MSYTLGPQQRGLHEQQRQPDLATIQRRPHILDITSLAIDKTGQTLYAATAAGVAAVHLQTKWQEERPR